MATNKSPEKDTSLPSSLRLLAPPLRMVSAAMWKVMKQRDVMNYGMLEEFVTSSCETVPGLLNFRHQAKLSLGLRARLILEQCRAQDPPDPKVILPQLERIRAPTSSSSQKQKREVKIERSVVNFCDLVQILLRDPTERALFYKDEFPVEYGPQFDQALEKLLWEFLIRLDQLLPVPNLAQTVSWLSTAPAVLEECARAASQPQLLKTLLLHQTCLGHLEPAAALPPCTGDSIGQILSSVSLPPSGRVRQNDPEGSEPTSVEALSPETNHTQVENKSLPITPATGLISSKDLLPLTASASERTGCCRQDVITPSTSTEVEQESNSMSTERLECTRIKERSRDDGVREEEEDEEVQTERNMQTRSHGLRCELGGRQPMIKEPEEEEVKVRVIRKGRRSVRDRVSSVLWKQSRGEGNGEESKEEMESGRRDGETERDHIVSDCMTTVSGPQPDLKLPEDPGLVSSLVSSCLLRRPRVLVSRLASADIISSPTMSYTRSRGNRKQSTGSPRGQGKRPKLSGRGEPVVARQRTLSSSPTAVEMEAELPGSADKENCAVSSVASCSPSLQRRSAESSLTSPIAGEDIIGDSEDEATKNFKARLFVKRYFRTKHDTYVPTLREFWKPGHVRRNLLSPGNGHR